MSNQRNSAGHRLTRRQLLRQTTWPGSASGLPRESGAAKRPIAQREAEHRRDRRGRPRRLGHRRVRQPEHRGPVRRGRPPRGRLVHAVSQGETVPRLPQDARRDGPRRSTRSSSARPTTPTPRPPSMAMKMGKHCYCEKPLAHCGLRSADDDRGWPRRTSWPRRWARRSTPATTIAAWWSWCESGAIGPVGEVHVWHPVAYGGGDRPEGHAARPAGARLGPLARPGPVSALSSRATCPARGGAGGTSAPAGWATSAATTWTCRSGR